MASKRKLGISFGIDSLDIIEIEKQNIITYINVPYLETQDKAEVAEIADEIKLAAILQKNLRDKSIETDEVTATIPSKDVLLRSFLIPYLPKSEIKTAIDFEARKFVPIKLDALYFDYLLEKTKENKAKRFKTHFVAIKKEILDKFIHALENSNLKVLSIETVPFSLLRLLLFKKIIKPNSNIAIIEVSQKEGSICIIEGGFPQLIRDFKFTAFTKDIYIKEPDSLSSFLNKEIRLSFDYFRRQSPKTVVSKIFLFTDEKSEQLKDNLSNEFNIPTTIIHGNEILGSNEGINIGTMKAYGAAIRDLVPSSLKVNLFQKSKLFELKEKKEEEEIPEIPVSRKSVIRTTILSGIFILLFYLFVDLSQISALNLKLRNLKQGRSFLKHKLDSLELFELQSLKNDYKEKIKVLEDVKKSKEANFVTPILDVLPSLMPEGVWLVKVNFDKKEALSLRLEGRAYSVDEEKQMNLVNDFFTNIKENKIFQENFSSIDFDFVRQIKIDKFPVTAFGITCR